MQATSISHLPIIVYLWEVSSAISVWRIVEERDFSTQLAIIHPVMLKNAKKFRIEFGSCWRGHSPASLQKNPFQSQILVVRPPTQEAMKSPNLFMMYLGNVQFFSRLCTYIFIHSCFLLYTCEIVQKERMILSKFWCTESCNMSSRQRGSSKNSVIPMSYFARFRNKVGCWKNWGTWRSVVLPLAFTLWMIADARQKRKGCLGSYFVDGKYRARTRDRKNERSKGGTLTG